MIPAERQAFIYQYACEHQLVTIEALAKQLQVSGMTIRRDIQALEKEGKIVAVSGGLKVRSALAEEPSYQEKSWLNKAQKEAIGIAAAKLVVPSQTLYLDAGTTTFEVAKAILARANCGDFKGQQPLTIISNDFSIIQYLMNQGEFALYHTGGEVDQRNGSTVGNAAAHFLQAFNIDMAFISTSSWDLARGISTPHATKIMVKQALLAANCITVLVTDSSKYGEYGRFNICSLQDFDYIFTDTQLPEEAQRSIEELGVNIALVSE